MKGWRAAAGLAVALTAAGPAVADQAEANRLLVEAIGLAAEAARAPREQAIELYARAVANLDAIVAQHPDASFAPLIATNQPVGAFRTWEVRRELARLTGADGVTGGAVTQSDVPEVACAAPCVWEHRFGDGLVIPGDAGMLLADLLLRPDGTVVAVGYIWRREGPEMWLGAYAPDGAALWERTYDGRPCQAALIDGGFVVFAEKLVHGEEPGVLMLLSDGLAPTGFPSPFAVHGIAADGRGGFLLLGGSGDRAVVARYDPAGDQTWRTAVDLAPVAGAADGAVVAAAASPGGGRIHVVGLSNLDGDAGVAAWTAVLDGDGAAHSVTELERFAQTPHRPCDPSMRTVSIDHAGDGHLLRYDWIDPAGSDPRTTVVRTGADGSELWRRVLPVDLRTLPDPQAAYAAGVDNVTAVAPTADGGVLVAGLRNRPMGQGAGYVSRWDAAGEPVWTTELRRVPEDRPVLDAFFPALAETADGGVLAAMSDGVLQLRFRGFLIRLGAGGEAP